MCSFNESINLSLPYFAIRKACSAYISNEYSYVGSFLSKIVVNFGVSHLTGTLWDFLSKFSWGYSLGYDPVFHFGFRGGRPAAVLPDYFFKKDLYLI